MSATVSWISRVEAYLTYRRRHGFALNIDETQLISFGPASPTDSERQTT